MVLITNRTWIRWDLFIGFMEYDTDIDRYTIWFTINYVYIHIWLVVWNMTFMTFHSVGNVIILTVTRSMIFQRGCGQPPTRNIYIYIHITIINHTVTIIINHILSVYQPWVSVRKCWSLVGLIREQQWVLSPNPRRPPGDPKNSFFWKSFMSKPLPNIGCWVLFFREVFWFWRFWSLFDMIITTGERLCLPCFVWLLEIFVSMPGRSWPGQAESPGNWGSRFFPVFFFLTEFSKDVSSWENAFSCFSHPGFAQMSKSI